MSRRSQVSRPVGVEKAFQEEGVACISEGVGLCNQLACLGDYLEFAILQQYQAMQP